MRGQIMGTLECMSPEQAGLGGLDVDTRTDIFSLGAILYEVLTGVLPLESKNLRSAAPGSERAVLAWGPPGRPRDGPGPESRRDWRDRPRTFHGIRGLPAHSPPRLQVEERRASAGGQCHRMGPLGCPRGRCEKSSAASPARG
jgi:serine/threonine protein kinase